MDDDLSHGGRTFDVERTVVPIIDGHLDTAVVTADEQDPGPCGNCPGKPGPMNLPSERRLPSEGWQSQPEM